MLRTINVCDQCGKECPYESIYVGIMPGTATESVDLCPIHMRMLMQKMVEGMKFEEAMAWAIEAKKPLPVRRV